MEEKPPWELGSSLVGEECEENGREREWGGREREGVKGFCQKLMRGKKMGIFIVLRRLGQKWGKGRKCP